MTRERVQPPFAPPGQGPGAGPPTSPPPSYVPAQTQQAEQFAVDPGGESEDVYSDIRIYG